MYGYICPKRTQPPNLICRQYHNAITFNGCQREASFNAGLANADTGIIEQCKFAHGTAQLYETDRQRRNKEKRQERYNDMVRLNKGVYRKGEPTPQERADHDEARDNVDYLTRTYGGRHVQ